ncbi:MAG: thiol-disulfide oxidoreductase DCC family protein, partial [Phycisphaerae bacterium]
MNHAGNAPSRSDLQNKPWEVEVFFDGGCPLCRREIDMLRRRDLQSRILFTDIDSLSDPLSAVGRSRDELMARIHGRLPDGTWIEGVEVFRRLYAAVGFRKLVFLTRLPLIREMLSLGYLVFAKNRLRFTGRCDSNG